MPNESGLHSTSENSQHRQKVRDYYNSMNSVIMKDVGPTYQAGLFVANTKDPFRATNLFQANRAGIQPGDRILDAGCGTGGPAIDIAQNIADVKIEGITISEEQAQTAQKLLQQAGLNDRIHIQVGDYHCLPFDDRVFDLVYLFESASYSDNLSRLFTEIYRVLRPGGTIYLKDVFSKEPPLSEKEEKDLAEFERIYASPPVASLRQMAVQVQQAGFEDTKLYDLSGVISTQKFMERMQQSVAGTVVLTDFGKFHYYRFQDLPIFFGDIKAYKPIDFTDR